LVFNVGGINNQSIADFGSSNITRLQQIMPTECQELVFLRKEKIERRGRKKGKESLVYRVVIRMLNPFFVS